MAKKIFDILLDGNEDMLIQGGDFGTGEVTGQNQKELLWTGPGEWKQNPMVGVDVLSFEDDENNGDLQREIVQQFMNDGMEVRNLQPNPAIVNDNTVAPFVNAYYQ